jgi:hypothetical protein
VSLQSRVGQASSMLTTSCCREPLTSTMTPVCGAPGYICSWSPGFSICIITDCV